MLGSPQVSRISDTQIECTSFQRLYMSLSNHRRLDMLDLRRFC
jgi:hypothetical protein